MRVKGYEDYHELPQAIRAHITQTEYAWLSDAEKYDLIENFTMPDPESEDQLDYGDT